MIRIRMVILFFYLGAKITDRSKGELVRIILLLLCQPLPGIGPLSELPILNYQ